MVVCLKRESHTSMVHDRLWRWTQQARRALVLGLDISVGPESLIDSGVENFVLNLVFLTFRIHYHTKLLKNGGVTV